MTSTFESGDSDRIALFRDETKLAGALLEISELELHVKWCIFHEGCNLYFVPSGHDEIDDAVRSIADLRDCFMAKEHQNQHAQDLIRNANDNLLMQVTMQAAAAIPSEFDLRQNFWWVAYHEGRMVQFREWNARHEFSAIRSDYNQHQQHNPNARNLLSAVNNRYVFDLVNSM